MFDGWKRGKLTTNSGATRNSFLFDFHPRLGGLHLFKQLAVKSCNLSQNEKKITVARAEQIKKCQQLSLKITTFDH